MYPIINAYLNGNLQDHWERCRAAYQKLDAKQSQGQAGCLAAAHLFHEFGTECEALERAAKTTCDDALFDLLDSITEHSESKTIQSVLVDLSGSRTLIADLDYIVEDALLLA